MVEQHRFCTLVRDRQRVDNKSLLHADHDDTCRITNGLANWQKLVGEYAPKLRGTMKTHPSNFQDLQSHPWKRLNERCTHTIKSAMRSSQMQLALHGCLSVLVMTEYVITYN